MYIEMYVRAPSIQEQVTRYLAVPSPQLECIGMLEIFTELVSQSPTPLEHGLDEVQMLMVADADNAAAAAACCVLVPQ